MLWLQADSDFLQKIELERIGEVGLLSDYFMEHEEVVKYVLENGG